MILPDIQELSLRMQYNGVKASRLARESGIAKSVLSRILAGKYNPSYAAMQQLWENLDRIISSESKSIKEIMVRDVVTAEPDASVAEVIQKMIRGGYSQIPVVRHSEFVGMVTEESLIRRTPGADTATDVLGSNYAVLDPMEPVEKARQLLKSCQAVAITEKGTLLGVLTKSDLLELG